MDKKTGLFIITIIMFTLGLWPIALLFLVIAIVTPNNTSPNKTTSEYQQDEIEQLKKEVEELKAEKFVQQIIDKTNNR